MTFDGQRKVSEELYICSFGEEICRPLHAYGPAQRDHYLIHFVVSGKGSLLCGGKSWTVTAGQGFLILPEEETYYQADADEPWHYAWVGYRGAQAQMLTSMAGIDEDHRIFTAPEPQQVWAALLALRREAGALRLSQLAAAGGLLRFMALIAPEQDGCKEITPHQACCDKAIWYMEGSYDRAVSIQETADFIGLSRSQLYRVMMETCGVSPKKMLLSIRMRHAAQLLRDTALPLESVAHRVGLQTGAQLGAAFKAVYGVTPGTFRMGRAAGRDGTACASGQQKTP